MNNNYLLTYYNCDSCIYISSDKKRHRTYYFPFVEKLRRFSKKNSTDFGSMIFDWDSIFLFQLQREISKLNF